LPKEYDEEKTASLTIAPGENWISASRKLKPNLCLLPSKWIKDLNIRPKTLKLVQERVENTLEAIGISEDFL
jgi:hypothetical protein